MESLHQPNPMEADRHAGWPIFNWTMRACTLKISISSLKISEKSSLNSVGQEDIKIGLPKCSFTKSSVKFVGHIVSKEGVRTDPGHIQGNFPQPTTVRRVRGFLGTCRYYRRFIANFAGIASPLKEITRKNPRFCWGEEQQVAFETWKTMMTNALVLKPPY
jgi:hypothetical protein